MTTWVERPSDRDGRPRGPVGLVRAWVAVLTGPRRFFRAAVSPGDQAPGLVFVVAVTAVAAGTRLAAVPAARPVYGDRPLLSAVLAVSLVALVLAPVYLHLVAAVQTLALVPFAPARAGVSETVQVLAYATAPCVLAGAPVDWLTAVAAGYGAVLLFVGLSEVHGVSVGRAAALGAVPAALVFGYAFGGFAAAARLVGV
ncbi:MAG: YIP1 family protein [Halobacteriaceae archaeon]